MFPSLEEIIIMLQNRGVSQCYNGCHIAILMYQIIMLYTLTLNTYTFLPVNYVSKQVI